MLKTYYVILMDTKSSYFSGMRSDYIAVETKNDPQNVKTALLFITDTGPVLFDSKKKCNDHYHDAAKSANVLAARCEITIDCPELEMYENEGTYYLDRSARAKIKEENITLCFPLLPHTEAFYNILEIKDLSRLEKEIRSAVHNIYYQALPAFTPINIVKCIEKVIKNSEQQEMFSLESIINFINFLSQNFCQIKSELEKHFLTQALSEKDIKSFKTFITNLEGIEKAINKKLGEFPETLEISLMTIPFKAPSTIANNNTTQSSLKIGLQSINAPKFNTAVTKSIASGYIQADLVKLREYPISHGIKLSSSDCLVLGDLHANIIKLIYFLIHENVIQGIDAKDYAIIFSIYLKSMSPTLTKEDINFFKAIINKISPVNPDSSPQICLVGDVLADRSGNDYLTLLFLAQINKLGIPFKIIFSNHDREFIGAYERGEFLQVKTIPYLPQFTFKHDSGDSLTNLGYLIKNNVITLEEVRKLVEEAYFPLLQGIGCSINEKLKKITFITHAPVDLGIISKINQELGIHLNPYHKWPENLIANINIINQKLLDLCYSNQFYNFSENGSALYSMMWNRIFSTNDKLLSMFYPQAPDLRINEHERLPEGWTIDYVHGHDGTCDVTTLNNGSQIINLNNVLGISSKNDDFPPEKYMTYYFGNNKNYLSMRKNTITEDDTVKQSPLKKSKSEHVSTFNNSNSQENNLMKSSNQNSPINNNNSSASNLLNQNTSTVPLPGNKRDRFKAALLDPNNTNELIACLQEGVSPNLIVDPKEVDTALHVAIKNKNIPAIKKLVAAGADIQKTNKAKLTSLQLAANLGYVDAIYAISEIVVDQKNTKLFEEAILEATAKNNLTTNTSTSSSVMDIDTHSSNSNVLPTKPKLSIREVYRNAIFDQDIQTIEECLKTITPTMTLDKDLNSALHYAIDNKNMPLIKLLLKNKANVALQNKQGVNPIQLAIEKDYYEFFEFITEDLSPSMLNDKQREKLKPFFAKCVVENKIDLIKKCIQLGFAAATPIDQQRNTGLHHAVAINNHELINFFLATHLVILKIKNAQGDTPIKLALEKNPSCLDLFIERMTSTSEKEINFFKEIFVNALFNNNLFVVECCLKAGFSPNTPIDSQRNTPLHYALNQNNMELAQLLMDYKVNIYEPNNALKTPIGFAVDKNNWELVEIFLSQIVSPTKGELFNLTDTCEAAFLQERKQLVRYLVKMGVPMSFLKHSKALTLFSKYAENKENAEYLDALLKYDTSGAIKEYCFGKILVKLPEELEEIFEDPILKEILKDPFIFPSGYTFEGNIAKDFPNDPFTRASITPAQGIKNTLVYDLIAYYRRPWATNEQLPPFLICPETGKLYKEPVVAKDGKTYEKSCLEKYLHEHQNKTPTGVLQDTPLYPNRLIIDVINAAHYSDDMIKQSTVEEEKIAFTKPRESKGQTTTQIFNSLNISNNNNAAPSNNKVATTVPQVMPDGTLCLDSFKGADDFKYDGHIIVNNNAYASGKLISINGNIQIVKGALNGPVYAKGSINIGKTADCSLIVAEQGSITVQTNVTGRCEMVAGTSIDVKGSITNSRPDTTAKFTAKSGTITINQDLMGNCFLEAFGDIVIKGNAIGQGTIHSMSGRVTCLGKIEGFKIIEDAFPKKRPTKVNNDFNVHNITVNGSTSSMSCGNGIIQFDSGNINSNDSFTKASWIIYKDDSTEWAVDNHGQKTVNKDGNRLSGLRQDAEVIFNGYMLQPDVNGKIDLDLYEKYRKGNNYSV